jgi:hypothetical protein
MLLGLNPGHTCDVINVVAEFMVGVAWVEPGKCVVQYAPFRATALTVVTFGGVASSKEVVASCVRVVRRLSTSEQSQVWALLEIANEAYNQCPILLLLRLEEGAIVTSTPP